jgi:TonB family protein
MNEPASEVIAARARVHGTLASPIAWSVAAHAAVIAALVVAPLRRSNDIPRTVMTISLSGASGPQTGGLTQIGGRAVTETPPAPPKPTPAPPRPAPPPKPAATLPASKPAPARPAQSARPIPASPTSESPRDGSTRVETGARGQGFGLSSGGNGSRGVELDVANFCCPEYIEKMRIAVERAWDRNQGVRGVTTMRFTILRDGTLQAVSVDKSSGFYALDNAATRALILTQRLPPLPDPFPNPTLTVHMRFEY